MKKVLSFLVAFVLLGAFASSAWAYTFSATAPSGQTLYFHIDSGGKAHVVRPGYDSIHDNYVTGDLTIPSSVTYNGVTYPVIALESHFYYNDPYGTFEGCTGLTSITIPSSITEIDNSAFKNCTGLTSVIFNADSCTYAGNSNNPVFQGCSNLTNITFGNNVKHIPSYLCKGPNGITSVTIGSGVTSIGEYAFQNCYLLNSVIFNADSCISAGNSNQSIFSGCTNFANITFGNNVKRIPDYLCCYCGDLTSVTIPSGVTSIGEYAFYHCTGLTSVTIPNGVTAIGSLAFSNVRHIKYHGSATGSPWGALSMNGVIEGDFVYSDSTKHKLTAYLGAGGAVTIPSTVDTIGQHVFQNCTNLTSVTIPNSVTSIGNSAFASCTGLTSITIPNSVTSIGSFAFSYCNELTSVSIGSSVTSIGASAFNQCIGLTSVAFNADSCISTGGIQDYSAIFYGCYSLTNITFGNNVKRIPSYLCYGCNHLTSVTIPDSVTSIGIYAFFGCSGLTSVSIGSSVSTIDPYAFCSCSGLTSVTIPNSVSWIGGYAFQYCTGLTSVTIPDNVTSIGSRIFKNCTGLTSVVIGNGVTLIDYYAFENCTGLTSLTIPNSVTSIRNSAFQNCSGLDTLIVGNGLTTIGYEAFANVNIKILSYNCPANLPSTISRSQLISVTIGDSVTSIYNSAFSGCSNLTSVAIGSGITTIGDEAFKNCTGLTSITIPNNVTLIGDAAFRYCSGLTSVTIPNSVTSMGAWVFAGCTGLTSVIFPNSITSIGDGAFKNCSSLTSVSIPNSVTSIGNEAFYNCTSLTSVTIPNSVTSIGNYALYHCDLMTNITFGSSVNTIGEGALSGCNQIVNIHMRGITPPTVQANTFTGVPTTANLYVPCNSVTTYANTAYWNQFNIIEEFPYSFSATSANLMQGSVQIIHAPECTNLQAEVQATPYNGFIFVQWSDGNTNAHRYIVVAQDIDIQAVFAEEGMLTVTVSVNNPAAGSVTGGGEYASGTTATLTANANSGYHFDHWSTGSTDNPLSFTVTSNVTITAYFEADPTTQYTITVTSNNNSWGTVTGGGTFDEGSQITISATANDGYHFVNWIDDNGNTFTNNPYTFTVTGNTTLTAIFEANDPEITYFNVSVTSANPEMGTVNSTASGSVAENTEVTATATPNPNYIFVNWTDATGSEVSTSASYTFTVTADITIIANFAPEVGINDIDASSILIYATNNTINVRGAEGRDLYVYDMNGRCIYQNANANETESISMPASGIYLVKVSNILFKKVVIVK